MLNLYLYKTDFGLEANWTFFATSHGKSHCDGIGRIVKRLTACASLQRQHSSQILTVASMLEFCQENIKDIKFCYLPKNKLQAVMLGAHERILPKQSVIPAILLEQISPVCGGKLVSNLPFLAESKISNMFDIFWHACHFAHCVRW